MSVAQVDAGPAVMTVYWMPGCSSCLRMKEFVERQGIPHVAVNAVESPASRELLTRMGLSVPAAVRGDKGVPGVDLAGVAQLAGIDYSPPEMLSPAALKARYLRILAVAETLIGQLSAVQLEHTEPDRPRTMRLLALHIVTIMHGFVDIEDTNYFRAGMEHIPADVAADGSSSDVLTVARGTRERFMRWWDLFGSTDPFDRVVESKTGYWTLHEAFERAVWHTTQHVRQLQFLLEHRFGSEPAARLTEADLAGLPLPAGIHASADG